MGHQTNDSDNVSKIKDNIYKNNELFPWRSEHQPLGSSCYQITPTSERKTLVAKEEQKFFKSINKVAEEEKKLEKNARRRRVHWWDNSNFYSTTTKTKVCQFNQSKVEGEEETMPSRRPTPWTLPHIFNMWKSESAVTRSRSEEGAEQEIPLNDPAKEKERRFLQQTSLTSLTYRNHRNNLSKEFSNDFTLPIVTVDGVPQSTNKGEVLGEVCHINENPFRILKVAEQGNLEEFLRLYSRDPSKMNLRDNKGRVPLHCAAFKNRLSIIEFIQQHGGDLNCQDNAGNTPLHAAIEGNALDAIELLISRGANTLLQNNKSQAPVHYCVQLDQIESLKVLKSHKGKVDFLQGGEHGRTALHLAAIFDHAECAELKDANKCHNIACNNGYYPIHEAAKCASAKTLEVLLRWGESFGCTRTSMMKFYDAEGNDPLHSAVNGGDIKAVQLCIESGARISSQQHDLSTPVHLASSQGALAIIKLMFHMQPEEKALCLSIGDAQKMTPLHCAAMFDHKDIVEYLVQQGGNINAVDKQHRSPLLLAASRGGWRCVEVLMRLEADITLKDVCNRNVLHFIVMNGGKLEHFADELSKFLDSLSILLDDKDTNGCTPMHYASKNGHCRSLENLIRLGARINLKNNDNQSPLHFAARYGRYNTAVKLLESDKGPFIINETDGEGETPLHIASANGHTRVVQLLLARGALLHRDHNGRTPLHLAASNGYTQTMELLLSFHAHLLDQLDKDGHTALHLAASNNKANAVTFLVSSGVAFLKNRVNATALDSAIQLKNSEAALAIVGHETRGYELLHVPSEIHNCIIEALIIHLPDVFAGVLDRSISQSNHKKDSRDYHIKYTFKTMQCLKEQLMMSGKKFGRARLPPLPAMNTMVQHGRVELLSHAVCQKYMQMKWNAYGRYFHLANLFVYIIFLMLLTSFVATQVGPLQESLYNQTTITANYTANNQTSTTPHNTYSYTIAVLVLVFIAVNVIKELFQFYQQKLRYLVDLINLFEWILYITSTITMLPAFTAQVQSYHVSCAAIAVFLAWFNFLISLQRFDLVGIYVVMFLEILNTLLKVLLLFSILIIAFGFSFHILMSSRGANQLAFRSAPMSLVRVFTMMLGDLDFMGTYVAAFYRSPVVQSYSTNKCVSASCDDLPTLPFPYFTFTMLVIFMVLMPILLMNLLIGLAVGDIEAVRRNAQLKRIAKQVELHSELERKLPLFLLQRGYQEEMLEYPNRPACSHSMFWAYMQRLFGTLTKLSVNTTTEKRNDDDYICEEMEKQKNRLKDIYMVLSRQQQLLRLIVQKMEIRTEADDFDEGSFISRSSMAIHPDDSGKRKSPNLRRKLRSAYLQRRAHVDCT